MAYIGIAFLLATGLRTEFGAIAEAVLACPRVQLSKSTLGFGGLIAVAPTLKNYRMIVTRQVPFSCADR
jgi:hypothetical protein